MDIVRKLVREFSGPFVVALCWVFLKWRTSATWSAVDGVTAFGAGFFFTAWMTGQYFRVAKQTHVERSFSALDDHLAKLKADLETAREDIVGFAGGAKDGAYFVPHIGNGGKPHLILQLVNPHRYPVFDFKASFWVMNGEGVRSAEEPMAVSVVLPASATVFPTLKTVPHLDDGDLDVTIVMVSRSGIIQQRVAVCHVSGERVIAWRVWDGPRVLHEVIPNGFPRDDVRRRAQQGNETAS